MTTPIAIAAICFGSCILILACSDSAENHAASARATAERKAADEPPAPDPDKWPSAIFAQSQAREHCKDMPLRFVIGSRFENRPVSNDKVDYVIHEWSFLYARSDNEYVLVSVDEKGARVNEALAKASGKDMRIESSNGKNQLVEADWESRANYPAIADWRVGSIRADEMAAKNGGHVQAPGSPFGQGLFLLRMGNESGKLIPFWFVPHRFTPDKKIVRADTGTVVKLDARMFN